MLQDGFRDLLGRLEGRVVPCYTGTTVVVGCASCSVWLVASGSRAQAQRVKYGEADGAARPVLDACATMSARPTPPAIPS
jgi:hypothetical protein